MDEPHPEEAAATGPDEEPPDDEIRLTGAAAEAQWRRIRPFFWGSLSLGLAIPLAAWVWWHPSILQLTCLGLAVGAILRAVFMMTFGLARASYQIGKAPGMTEKEFIAKRRPDGAVAFWLVAGVVLIIASTPTGIGRWLASTFDIGHTVYEAGRSVVGVIGLSIAAVLLGGFVLLGLWLLVMGSVDLVILPFRKVPRSIDDSAPGMRALMGVLLLSFLAGIAYAVWSGWPALADEILGPFRRIGSWF
jgi:hypothetical protein